MNEADIIVGGIRDVGHWTNICLAGIWSTLLVILWYVVRLANRRRRP